MQPEAGQTVARTGKRFLQHRLHGQLFNQLLREPCHAPARAGKVTP